MGLSVGFSVNSRLLVVIIWDESDVICAFFYCRGGGALKPYVVHGSAIIFANEMCVCKFSVD